MNKELWSMFEVSGHVEDYLRYVYGDEKFDRCFNFSDDYALKDGDNGDWSDRSNGYGA